MIGWLRRTLAFARFSLAEYVRSGRILVEVLALVVLVWIVFWPRGSGGLDVGQFFTIGSIYTLVLATYSTAAVVGLGRRAPGYVVLIRPVGRAGYVVGLQLAAFAVVLAAYLALSGALVALYAAQGRPQTMSLDTWALGSAPLLLDVAIVNGFVTLLTPLVVTATQRIVILGVLAVGLTSDLRLLDGLSSGGALATLQSLVGLALLPATSGLDLAIRHSYGPEAAWILGAQSALALFLLTLSLLAFGRRELILPS